MPMARLAQGSWHLVEKPKLTATCRGFMARSLQEITAWYCCHLARTSKCCQSDMLTLRLLKVKQKDYLSLLEMVIFFSHPYQEKQDAP